MKGFMLDSNGDVHIDTATKSIVMIEGNELLRQTVQCVLGTNKGEWVLNADEGIDFHAILGKHQPPQQSKGQAEKHYYSQQITGMRTDMNKAAKKLEKRLDGEL